MATSECAEQYARLDELLEKGEHAYTDADWEEFEALAHLLADPGYQAYRRAMVEAATQGLH